MCVCVCVCVLCVCVCVCACVCVRACVRACCVRTYMFETYKRTELIGNVKTKKERKSGSRPSMQNARLIKTDAVALGAV